jgi:hypothetical protein
MPFLNTNDFITGRRPIQTPAGCEMLAVRFTLAMATADLALNTIGEIGSLPAGCIPVDVYVDGTDMDNGAAAMVLQVGIWDGVAATLSTAAEDGGKHWGVTAATNTDFCQRITPNGNALAAVAPSASNRKIGVRVQTAPTTPAAGTLGVTVLYRAA